VRRQAELERRAAAEREPSPAGERLGALERRIAAAETHLADLAREREALGRERYPDPDRLARTQSTERLAARQMERLRDERDALAIEVAGEARRAPALSGAERVELALISERLTQLRRREVARERAQPSKLIEHTLGARPKDPLEVAHWNAGVELIYGYRQRHGITSTGGHPLGPKPREAARRRERQQAELRLARIQERLGKERARVREHDLRLFR
jgi:hypothetical protein